MPRASPGRYESPESLMSNSRCIVILSSSSDARHKFHRFATLARKGRCFVHSLSSFSPDIAAGSRKHHSTCFKRSLPCNRTDQQDSIARERDQEMAVLTGHPRSTDRSPSSSLCQLPQSMPLLEPLAAAVPLGSVLRIDRNACRT